MLMFPSSFMLACSEEDINWNISFSVFLWDVMLMNEKDSHSFAENSMSNVNTLIFFSSNGTFYFVRLLQTKVRCPMELHSYPHDTQECIMRFQSYGYNYNTVNFTKPNVVLRLSNALESPSFELKNVTSSVSLVPLSGNLYSECSVTIILQRKLAFFLYQVWDLCFCCEIISSNDKLFSRSFEHSQFRFSLHVQEEKEGKSSKRNCCVFGFQVFIPTFLMVLCSWLVFWVDVDIGSQVRGFSDPPMLPFPFLGVTKSKHA